MRLIYWDRQEQEGHKPEIMALGALYLYREMFEAVKQTELGRQAELSEIGLLVLMLSPLVGAGKTTGLPARLPADGFPRTVAQAQSFWRTAQPLDAVINIEYRP